MEQDSHQQQQYGQRLRSAILSVSKSLDKLGKLGRAGQWILHNEDLYEPYLDTRPQSRNPDEEICIRDLSYGGLPLSMFNLIWAGRGPLPDFQDATFWETKREELEEKIDQVEAGSVRPGFTPEEQQILESLEQQDDHFFRISLNDRRRNMEYDKHIVFGILFDLAALGRPGQWILHHEDLYHRAIDTRSRTRKQDDGGVLIQNFVHMWDPILKGNIIREAFLDCGIQIQYELIWVGQGSQPDFADPGYWARKVKDLREKKSRAQQGLVRPQFTPEELRTLESMEQQEGHLFAEYARHQRENPLVIEAPTAQAQEAAEKLLEAKFMVREALRSLWECNGLAGKWVLHSEKLYIPSCDIRFRDRDRDRDRDDDEDGDEDNPHRHVILADGADAMCYDGTPLPDFDSIAYWQEKFADLQQKRRDVQAGKVEHHFTRSDLMQIRLLEVEAAKHDVFDDSDDSNPARKDIAAWIDGHEQPAKTAPLPLSPVRAEGASPASSGHGGRGLSAMAADTAEAGGSGESQLRDSRKRRRTVSSADEPLVGQTMPPTKRSKTQPQPGPASTKPPRRHMPEQTRLSPPLSPPDTARDSARAAAPPPASSPAHPRRNARHRNDHHTLGGQSTQTSTSGIVRGGNRIAKRQRVNQAGEGAKAATRPGSDRRPGKEINWTTNSPRLRRSARIAALPRKES